MQVRPASNSQASRPIQRAFENNSAFNRSKMYRHSASYYDLIYRDQKDYAAEAQKIDYLLSKFSPKPKRLLDVACGTGSHAFQLAQNYGYAVDGIDIQPDFVRIAASKLPSARFETADMRSFDLGCSYDAVLCLFSSIGYAETPEGLEQTIASMAKHLAPKGWLICEPWLTPETWKAGQIDVLTAEDQQNSVSVTRTRTGKTEGAVSIMEIEYFVEENGSERTLRETHRLGLFSHEQMNDALKRNGLTPRWAPQGLQMPHLVFAQK